MMWKILLVLAAAVGAVVFASHRQHQRELADGALWAEATDPVVRFGD